jgi:histidinol-phosphatase
MNADWKSRYNLAIDAARQAGDQARRYFEGSIEVEWKADESPVTVADKKGEEIIRSAVKQYFPGDGFLGEEYGDEPSTTGFRWIIDPIDGTRSFVRKIPIWGTLVGLEYRGELIAGVTYAPMLGDVWRALRGDGAYVNDQPMRVSTIDAMSKGLFCYSSISWFRKAGREKVFHDLVAASERQRGFGDFYGFVLVAQGSCEVMVDHGVSPWDVAAVLPIVEEAGGSFTDWSGKRTIHSKDVIATNGSALAILNQA